MLNGKEGRLLRRNNDKDTRMKINILLCDDDKDFLQRISDAVAGQPVPPGASICITKSSNPAEITDRQLSQYHIMFLDIDMDERSGMDIARRVRELHLDTVIVFVTNYPEFSMEGYEVRAFRYLLKQELEQKLANYFRDALAELPRDDKVLRFSASAESFNIPYSLQRKFMNFGGFFILVCFGTLVAPLPQVILLNFGLALLREKTNGLHMPTVFSCFITSLFCEYACLYLIDRLQSSTIAAAITLFIVSAMLILILAPCNNSAMHCSNEELRDMKIAVRKRLVLYCLIIPALLLLKPLYSIVWIVAAVADALLLVLAKIGVGIK